MWTFMPRRVCLSLSSSTVGLCYGVLAFLLVNTICIGFFPRSFSQLSVTRRAIIAEIVAFLVFIMYAELMNYVDPFLNSYAWYTHYVGPYFTIPLLTVANAVVLFICHVVIR